MFRSVLIDALAKVTDQNFNDFGNYPRQTFDIVIRDLFGQGRYFSGFLCTDGGSGRLIVSAGRFYFNGVGYYNDTEGGEQIDLLQVAPVVNTKWVAIVASPKTLDTNNRPTTYLTDTTTRATIARVSPQESRRFAEIQVIQGTTAAEPSKPLATSDVVVVAYVLLGPAGIVRIEANEPARAPTITGNAARLDENDQWRVQTGTQIEALSTNINAIAGKLKDSASLTFVNQLTRDVAALKLQAKMPSVFSSYDFETYLTDAKSDTLNVDYLASVEEGVRFAAAQIQEAQLQLLNPLDAQVRRIGDMLFPIFREEARILNLGTDATIAANSYTVDSYQIVTKTMVRERLRVGSYYIACSNWFWWVAGGGSYDARSGIMRLNNGEMYEVYPDDRYIVAADAKADFYSVSHVSLRIRQVWNDGYEEVAYTDTLVNRSTAAGIITGNTVLSPQDGWATSLMLFPQTVGPAGDVTVYLLETTKGQPDLTKALGKGTMLRQTMIANQPVVCTFDTPIALKKGTRYAFAVVTSGAHTFYGTKNNRLSNGSFFAITDGAWAVPDATLDYSFGLNFAVFNSNRVTLQMQPLSLANGIAAVDITAVKYVPTGQFCDFQGQFAGKWRALNSLVQDDQPFVGLPPLVPLQVVFQGTYDNMPALGIASLSKVVTKRPRSDFRHISAERIQPVGVPAKTIVIETRLEGWRGAPFHTHGVKLRTGAGFTTITNPSMVVDQKAPDDPNALIRKSTFVMGTAVPTFKIEQNGTTDNTLRCFHVALRSDIAQAT